MKINIDVAVSKNSGRAAAAAIARDGSGLFIGASVLILDRGLDPETVEALACREGVALATDLNLSKVQLACDSANVVRSIKSIALGSYGHVVREIQASSSCFESFDFVHKGRESNGDAHSLARSSVSFELRRQVWFFEPPEGICTRVTMNQ